MIVGDENAGDSEQVYPTAVPPQWAHWLQRLAPQRFSKSARPAETVISDASQTPLMRLETSLDKEAEGPEPAMPRGSRLESLLQKASASACRGEESGRHPFVSERFRVSRRRVCSSITPDICRRCQVVRTSRPLSPWSPKEE